MSCITIFLFLLFNILALISGCLALGSSLYFHMHGFTQCQHALQVPLMVMGIYLIVISLLGLTGGFCRHSFLLWFYALLVIAAFLGLTVFTIYAYIANNPAAGSESLSSGVGFKKHNLGDYSLWLQNSVENGKNWNRIKACLIDHHVCKRLDNNIFHNAEALYKKKLSDSVEFGCCKPPTQCGYEYKNATFWVVPKLGPTSRDRDCKLWSNEQDKLCYNCNSCKARVVDMTKMIWRMFTIFDTIDIAITIILFTLSCCIRRKILSDMKYTRVHP